jgi:hypothetical protein
MPTDELTHDEEVELALQIMGQRFEEDMRAGQEWLRRQHRIIIIKDGEGA